METPSAVTSPSGADLADEAWARLLAGDGQSAERSPLYGPFLAPPRAPDGCVVLARIAQSIDGRIATSNGASFWISGEADILHTHRLRALADAIVVGAGTVRADDPQLTTRACTGPSPVRVVIDTDRRLGPDYRVFCEGPPTIVLCATDAPDTGPLGIAAQQRLPRAPAGGLDIDAALGFLATRGLRRIVVEGGGITVSRFLAAGGLDRLHVTVAPLLLGSGIPAFTLPEAARPQDGMRLRWALHRLGSDILLDIPLDRARPNVCP
jgi:riboflavin-specific deaminase-like protein